MAGSMNGLMIGGAALVLLGVLGLAIPQFTTEHTKDVAKVGDLKLQTEESTPHFVPPAVSATGLVLGVVLLGAGFYRRR
jgi:hypothetical protein